MLYTLSSEYYDSNYILIDWERLDACIKPTDTDARGRKCGKRAKGAKAFGKAKASSDLGKFIETGSDEAKQLAAKFRAAKGLQQKEKVNIERHRNKSKVNASPVDKARFRRAKEENALINDPAAEKALRRKAKKSGSAASRLMDLQAKKATRAAEEGFKQSESKSIARSREEQKGSDFLAKNTVGSRRKRRA